LNTRGSSQKAFLKIGFHAGGFNSAYISFEKAVRWAEEHGVHGIECGFVGGVTWNHGLGYFPHVASWEDPKEIRRMLDRHKVELSQIDAAFPLSGSTGPRIAVPYVIEAIRWAAHAGCPMVDTTDGLHKPSDLSEEEAMDQMRRSYREIVEAAERYGIVVTIETHGYFTANPDRMAEMLAFVDSPFLQMTMDTGNVFIAGQDPVKFLVRFLNRVGHVHIKDVAPRLSETVRGKQTGIGMSHCSIGEGVNAKNIRRCLELLRDQGFRGAVSLECEAQGGPVLERSLRWVREVLKDLNLAHDLDS
jgi:sugar phosphate isomerase/epimerase